MYYTKGGEILRRKIIMAVVGTVAALSALAFAGAGHQAGLDGPQSGYARNGSSGS